MNYSEGVKHMQDLASKLEEGQKSSFKVGNLIINYPGYKKRGDYQLTIDGFAPKHMNIVREIYEVTSENNIESIIDFLNDVYINGLSATSTVFSLSFIEKIYWITLQEEINYPPPQYKGRKLPFQRFYEGALAKVITKLEIESVEERTNNHGRGTPVLFKIKSYPIPSFYN